MSFYSPQFDVLLIFESPLGSHPPPECVVFEASHTSHTLNWISLVASQTGMKALNSALPREVPPHLLQLVALFQRDTLVPLEDVGSHRRTAPAPLTRSHTFMLKTKLLSLLLIPRLAHHVVEARCREVAVLARVVGEVPEHRDHGPLVLAVAALRLEAIRLQVGAELDARKSGEERLVDGETGIKCVITGLQAFTHLQVRTIFSIIKPSRVRESSVPISADWALLEEIEFTRLSKLRLDVDKPGNMYVASCQSFYNV